MDQLSRTAQKLDKFFKFLQVAISIGIVCCLVGLAILAAGFLFDLDLNVIGNGWNNLDLGFLELEVAESSLPGKNILLLHAAIVVIYTLLCLIFVRLCVRCIRCILEPMTQGQPFHSTVSKNLRKLANYCLFLGVAGSLLDFIARFTMANAFSIHDLLLGDKITHVTYNYSFDLTFVVVAAALCLLSYIFRYGEQLQQLSDETL